MSATRLAVSGTVNAVPANPTGTNGSRCGSGTVTISASSSGAVIDWYSAATSGTSLTTGASYTPSITASTTYYAQARNSTTGCISASRTAVLASTASSTTAPTASGGSRCGSGTVTLSASSSGAVIDWYSAATGGSVLSGGSATNNYTTPSISSSRTYYAQARIVATGCVSSRTPVLATINSQPSTPTGTNGSRCGTGAVIISATRSGAEIDWYSKATGGTLLLQGSDTYTTPVISFGSTYYAEARIAETGCVSTSRRAVTASTTDRNSTPSVTHGGLGNCGASGTVTLLATRSESVIDWYDAATDGTLLLSGSNTFTTPDIWMSSTYYAEAYNPATECRSTRAAVYAYTNTTPPATPTVPAGFSCGSGTVTLTANAISNATVDWYSALTGGTLLKSGTATGDRSFTTPSISTSTTYYAQSRNIYMGCVSARVPVLAIASSSTLTAPAAPTVSGNVTRCGSDTVTLSATPPSGAVVVWYDAATGGSVLSDGVATNDFTPSVSSTYYAGSRIEGCVSATRTPVVVTINTVPYANGSNVKSIGGGCNGTVTLTASGSSGAVVDWYDVPTGGTKLYTGASYTTPILYTSTKYYYEARIESTGCVSDLRHQVEVQLTDAPFVESAYGVNRCGAGTVSLSAHARDDETDVIDWYSAPTGGTLLVQGDNYYEYLTTPSISTSTTYYAQARNTSNGCISMPRTPVLAGVYSSATITTQPQSPVSSVCPWADVPLSVVASGEDLSYRWLYNGSTITTPGIGYKSANLYVKTSTNTSYTVIVGTGGACSVTSNQALVVIGGSNCCDLTTAGTTMQAFNPPSCVPVGATWELRDTRDNNVYKVRYFPDGRYWMNSQLKFGDKCNKTTFSATTVTDQLANINSTGTYYGDCSTNMAAYAGYYYDWAAAMNRPGAYAGSGAIPSCEGTGANTTNCRGICPYGWHLPTMLEANLYYQSAPELESYGIVDYPWDTQYGWTVVGCGVAWADYPYGCHYDNEAIWTSTVWSYGDLVNYMLVSQLHSFNSVFLCTFDRSMPIRCVKNQ